MRVLVCGGREFADKTMVWDVLDRLNKEADTKLSICEGGALGADRLARQWASSRKVSRRTFYADWSAYGRSAGAIRNKQMLDEFKPELVVAFPGGNGTADMVRQARRAGVPVLEPGAARGVTLAC